MTPQSEVVAAIIGAAAAIVAAVGAWIAAVRADRTKRELSRSDGELQTALASLNMRMQLILSDRSRESELVVSALNHLIGRSQERAAGLAALHLLKSTTPSDRWAGYEDGVQTLLTTQLIYVLTRGRNRWEAHEVENIRSIATWFLRDDRIECGEAQSRIISAALSYIKSWASAQKDGEDHADGGKADVAAVGEVIDFLKKSLQLEISTSP